MSSLLCVCVCVCVCMCVCGVSGVCVCVCVLAGTKVPEEPVMLPPCPAVYPETGELVLRHNTWLAVEPTRYLMPAILGYDYVPILVYAISTTVGVINSVDKNILYLCRKKGRKNRKKPRIKKRDQKNKKRKKPRRKRKRAAEENRAETKKRRAHHTNHHAHQACKQIQAFQPILY